MLRVRFAVPSGGGAAAAASKASCRHASRPTRPPLHCPVSGACCNAESASLPTRSGWWAVVAMASHQRCMGDAFPAIAIQDLQIAVEPPNSHGYAPPVRAVAGR